MKICHIVDELRMGGLEKNLIEIVVTLPGHEHEVWCLRRKGALAGQLEGRHIPVREFGFNGGMTVGRILRLVREMRKKRFDIIHSHGSLSAMWGEAAAVASGVAGRIDHAQNLCSGIPRNLAVRMRLLSYAASKIIAVSDAVKESLVRHVGIGPGKIVVIYNSSPDMGMGMMRSRREIREGLGFSGIDCIVGSVGRLEEHKGQSFLIDAIARVRAKGRQCGCLIVGDGPAADSLRERARRAGLEKIVLFTGWREDIAECLAAMDIFVQPSTLVEGLPLALAEAASASLPIIATDIGGNREVVAEGVNGFVIPPKESTALAERIERLIDHPREAHQMGERSRSRWQERFRAEDMAMKIDAVYKAAVQARKAGG